MQHNPPLHHVSLQDVVAELEASDHDPSFDLLKVRTANQWIEEARCRPVPAELFGPFWFEGELGILFADTNVGKSILAVQIADALSRVRGILPFSPKTVPLKVLYADFELSDKQFENRYSTEYQNHYRFNDRFLRAEINPDYEGEEEDFEALLLASFQELVVANGVEVLIVDNLTYLATENEKARNALPLMKALNKIKRTYRLSILVLAHTPKRDPAKPIGTNDLAGSKALMNLCDSAFAIGASAQDSGMRYLKQIKVRNAEKVYDAENVLTFQVVKVGSFLHFDHIGNDTERLHLKVYDQVDVEELENQVLELHQQKRTQRQIAGELGLSLSKVNRILNKS